METGLTRFFFKLPVLKFDLARVLDLLTSYILEVCFCLFVFCVIVLLVHHLQLQLLLTL